jgi:putative DNA primase/helicase
LITSFNQLPRAEATHGFYRRFLIIPFGVTIDEKNADVNLASKLKQELPGILNWVLEGLRRYLVKFRFSESKVCEDALYNYRLSSNSVMLFVDEACEPNGEVFPINTNGITLYSAYKLFCNDLLLHPLGRNNFYDQLVSLGIQRIDKQHATFFNIKLNND